ncbi:Uncharacterised protein [BD1-7 clade bacterium]|nr:Uncharacterised protein [BD1-7 clade bacterium]
MVSVENWIRLSDEEKKEYQTLSSGFIEAVQMSGARDGYDFGLMYRIHFKDGVFFLARECSGEPFAGITSCSKKVIETLHNDVVQNYGR